MKPSYLITFILAAGLLLVSLPCKEAHAQEESDLPAKLAEAIDLYLDLQFDAGLEVTQQLMAHDNLTSKDSIAIFEVMSLITYAKGEKYRRLAFDYLDKISSIGPCVLNLPRDLWPQELRDRWFRISKDKDALVCEEPSADITTIAIMEFDNHSIGEYQEELGFLAKGLADFFEYDFAQLSNLKVVERDKINFILDELELAESGMVDAATAAKAGKLLGAQLMVFGSITQLDDDQARMIVRVVKTETSEILASVSKDGEPEFVEMENELVKELAKKLNLMYTDESEALINEAGPDNLDAARLYAIGLDFMDKYEYEKAFEYFKMAYEKDNTFTEAKRKMDIYRPLVS